MPGSMPGAQPGGRELAVEARGVAVAYERTRDKSTLIALEDFTLDVAEGEFLAIVGPSGCGKSTFLNVVAGLVAGGGRRGQGLRQAGDRPRHRTAPSSSRTTR